MNVYMKKKLIIPLLALVGVIILIVGVAWAKYISTLNGTATAQIARFNFNLVNGIPVEQEVPNLALTRNDSNEKVEAGTIAPNTHGQFQIGVNIADTDTSMAYEINIDVQGKPKNLHFYANYNEQSGYNYQLDTEDGKIRLTGFLDYGQANEEMKTIYWNWAYQTGDTEGEIAENDRADSEFMGKEASMNIVAKGYEVINPKIKRSNGEIVTLTKSNVATYYGEEVEYMGNGETSEEHKTYRLFYVDFENKYKDGAGTIYIKSDFDENHLAPSWTNDVNGTKMSQMNPAWEIADGEIEAPNETICAYLTNPSKWTKYVGNNANYAIGTPSIEMYTDSYNQSFGTNYKYSYVKQGYKISVNGIGYMLQSIQGSISRMKNGMYSSIKQYQSDDSWCAMWLSSPSDWHRSSCFNIKVNSLPRYDSNTYGTSYGYICPVVSIKSDAVLNLK